MWDTKSIRGHGKELRNANYRKDIKRFSFSHRSTDIWSRLDTDSPGKDYK